MKKRILISIVACASLVIVLLITMCHNHFSNYLRVVEANWKLTFPKAAHLSEVYAKDSDTGFNGDGIRYHIYSYPYNYTDYLCRSFNWKSNEGATIYYPSFSTAATEYLNNINVPETARPPYSSCLYLYMSQEDNSELLIFLNTRTHKLYILESFM